MKLVVVQGPESVGTWDLQPGENAAGREPENPIHLPSRRVSRRHCVFTVQNDRVFVRDLGSANGVVVEGRRVHEAEIQHGQRLQLGDFLLALEAQPAQVPSGGWHQQQAPPPQQPPPQQQAPPPQAQGGWGQPEPPASTGWERIPSASQEQPAWGQPSASQEQPAWGQEATPQEQQSGWAQQPPPSQEKPAWGQQTAPQQQGQSGWGVPAGGSGGTQPPLSEPQGGGPPAWGQQASYDEVGLEPGLAPDYSVAPGASSITREVSGGLQPYLQKALQLLKQMPFPARLGVVLWAAVLVQLLSPVGGLLPLVDAASGKIEVMSVERGIALAELVGYRNLHAIVDRKSSLIDTRFLEGRPGVKFAMVTDSRGVVLAPAERAGKTLEKNQAYVDAAMEGRVGKNWEDGLLELMVPIKAVTHDGAPISTVGYAYLLYDARDVAAMVGSLTFRFSLSILLMVAVAVALFLAFWRLAVVPIVQLREETELAVKGHQEKAFARVHWRQLEELAHSINRAVTRMDGHAPEEDQAGAGRADPRVDALLLASGYPVLVIDDRLCIVQVNAAAAYTLGVAEEGAVGSNVIDLLPEREVGAKLRRMLDAIGASQGNVFSDMVVLSGQERRVTVAGEPGGQGGAPRYSVVVIT